jgi:hypothetical protein
MIVRDTGDAWQVVLQTDHAELSGDFARAWGNERFDVPRPLDTVARAAARHDDGWAIWERAPSLLQMNGGPPKPRNFLDVQIINHLAFYRAQIAAVSDEDRYAGMLISMHGAGIYNGRYGTDPELKLTFAPMERTAVDGFITEQESRRDELVDELGLTQEELWTNYKLLQIYDRLSLHFCMKDVENGESGKLTSVPITYDGEETELSIQADGPWKVKLDPFPFAEGTAKFTLLRRTIPKKSWPDNETFREDFFATPVEKKQIEVSPA